MRAGILAGIFAVGLWLITLSFALPVWIATAGTLIVGLGVVGHLAYVRHRARQSSRELERALANQAQQLARKTRPDQRAALGALQSEFERAISALRTSKLAEGRDGALYALPWYVIIGPPGAGKSTAIRQSGLRFPRLGSQAAIRGTGGTRNCDWWMTNDAILLDTAGRYATEDDDLEEWRSFLDLLRRRRPRHPLNGLIVAISIEELAGAREADLDTLACKIRERIDEVMGRLSMVLPVYVLLTKCDLLPGFIETFEGLPRAERAQVLGFTLAAATHHDLEARVGDQWTRLAQVVERQAIARLADTRGREARKLVYEFPQHLEALRANVVAFLGTTFANSVYEDVPLVRGVYLTSGTQAGTPIDRLMGTMAATLGLPAPAHPTSARGEPRSYFLGDLFTQVMFQDRHLAVRNRTAMRRMHWVRWGTAALLGTCAVGLSAMPGAAYVANRGLVRSSYAELTLALAKRDQPGPRVLSALEPLRSRLHTLDRWDKEGAPLRYRLGLYQGGQLHGPLRGFYATTLRTVLLQPAVAAMEHAIAKSVQAHDGLGPIPGERDRAELYERTRAYLLMTAPKAVAEPHLDATLQAWLVSELAELWSHQGEGAASPADRDTVAGHMRAYVALLSGDPTLAFSRNSELVRQSRELLSRMEDAKLAIDRVTSDVDALGWDLTFDKLVAAPGLPVSALGRVRGAFTRRGWEEHIRGLLSRLPEHLLSDPWVVDAGARTEPTATTEARLCALRSEYFGRYIEEWKSFIEAVRVEEPANHERAIIVLQDLTRGEPPPLERLMRAVAHHAQLGPSTEPRPSKSVPTESGGVLDQLRARVQSSPAGHLIAASKDPCLGGEYLTPRDVARTLAGFFSFGASLDTPQPGGAAPLTSIQVYQEQLAFVRDALQSFLDDRIDPAPLMARLASARTRVRSLIEAQEIGVRPRFDALLWPPINGASTSSGSILAGEKSAQWCNSVALPFARSLRDRYPFSKQGQDAALADVTEFYRPQSGVLWAFYEATLKRDISRVGGQFQAPHGTNANSMYKAELLRFLGRSHQVSSALFPPGSDKPRVDFEVRIRPAPGIAQVTLTIDGQSLAFHNGPEKWSRMSWPGAGGASGASLRIRGARSDETLSQAGEWGLFRLLDRGTVTAAGGERFFTVRFRLHTQSDVMVDIRPARSEHPFLGPKAYLETFRAEGVMAPRSISSHTPPCPE